MADEIQTLVGGLRAIELYYRPIREIASGNTVFFQSQTRLNTPGLGVLTPENFRDVAEITNQCITLFELEFGQLLEAAKKFTDRDVSFNWLSVYMPADYLRDIRAEKNVVEFCQKAEVHTNRVCFAVSGKLLEEQDGRAAMVIKNLRNRGFHFMLTGFGADSCPMMKLSEFPVDYVMLSPEVADFLGKTPRSEGAVKSIVEFVGELDATAIADGVRNAPAAEALFSFGCNYVCGSLAGKYVGERYVRKKNDDEKS
ncbi:MAG: EAL domain-containing protein [Ruminococcus sp.]|nr:EAL domain-containing protein [Ruminococcus sp.]